MCFSQEQRKKIAMLEKVYQFSATSLAVYMLICCPCLLTQLLSNRPVDMIHTWW